MCQFTSLLTEHFDYTINNVKPRACEPALLTAYLWRSISFLSSGDPAQK